MFTFPVILRLIIGALMIGSVYAVLGMGYSLIYKATGLMNLAMGDFLMLGAFVGLTFYKTLGLNIYLSFILTFVVMFIVGYVTQRYLITVLLDKGASFAYIILCTAGLSLLFQNGVQLVWAPFTLQFPAIFSKASVPFLGIKVAPENLLVLALGAASAFGLHFFLNKTRFGTAMRASALDQTAASSVGINVGLTKKYLLRELRGLGISVLAGDANYLLLSGAPGLYEGLLEKGILIRNCENYRGLSAGDCRIAVRTHEENQALISTIREVIHA